jgi:hypothetical protein
MDTPPSLREVPTIVLRSRTRRLPLRFLAVALVAVLAVGLASCGDDDDDEVVTVPGEPSDTAPDDTAPDDTAPHDTTPDDGEPGEIPPGLGVGAPLPDDVGLGWLGLTRAEAEERAESEDRMLRVTREDDESFPLTDDLGDGRVNIALDDGLVTFAMVERIDGVPEREGAENPADLGYVGLAEGEAGALADEQGHGWRVVTRDGEGLPVTMDYRPDRRNFDVVEDLVVAVTRG